MFSFFLFVRPLLGVIKKQLWEAHAPSHSAGSPTIVNTKRREVSVVRHIGWTKSWPVDRGQQVLPVSCVFLPAHLPVFFRRWNGRERDRLI